ncbi:MAG TPA: hypothetical protein VHD62_00320 [Opitutaceae bacterium]|nr:hypothetical protein [Opitutaceae bacterium]
MIHLVLAFGILLHVLFWGAGLALLATPRAWRRFWPVLIAPAGLALQSLVVWAGAFANFPGTNRYAWWSEIVPLVLLALGGRRRGWRAATGDVGRFGLVFAIVAGNLAVLILPLWFASRGLTTISLGSCDAADYAAGARVLQEFAHADRGGFLGLTEVVRVMSVDNFFDFWLRLNHFTPAALLALNGTIFGCAPHELVSVLAAVLFAATAPVVFWVSRAVMRYSGGVSLFVAALYALSPIGWYAFGHAAMGQLLAAPGIALVTWAGVALWRVRLTWRHAFAWSGVLAIGYALLLGGYNFILLVCWVPAVAYAGSLVLWTGAWARFARWLLAMIAPLAVCGLVFAARVAGLTERFVLFQTYDFGWKIPAFTPEGWLGMVSGPELRAWSFGGLRWALTAIVVAALGVAFVRAIAQRRRNAWTAACLAVPVLIGYEYLESRGARLGTNASYDAYKLFAVFYPELLPAFCWWVTLRWSRRLSEWFAVVALALFVLAFNAVGSGMIFWRLCRPPLIVDGELRQLRKVEAMPDVKSVNLLVPDMWSRLWANEFLLRKEQYFATHTYEGRLNTPLRGDWDLRAGLIAVKLPGEASRQITAHYSLVNVRDVRTLRAEFGEGWFAEEQLRGTTERWRWSGATGALRFENPHAQPLRVVCTLDARSVGERDFDVVLADGRVVRVHAGEARAKIALPSMTVPPGGSTLVLRAVLPVAPPPGETRALGLCVFGATIEVQE